MIRSLAHAHSLIHPYRFCHSLSHKIAHSLAWKHRQCLTLPHSLTHSLPHTSLTHLPQMSLQVRPVDHEDLETRTHHWERHALIICNLHMLCSVWVKRQRRVTVTLTDTVSESLKSTWDAGGEVNKEDEKIRQDRTKKEQIRQLHTWFLLSPVCFHGKERQDKRAAIS